MRARRRVRTRAARCARLSASLSVAPSPLSPKAPAELPAADGGGESAARLEALRAELDAKEDAMQAAVDRDDFEEAARLQDEVDVLSEEIDAFSR